MKNIFEMFKKDLIRFVNDKTALLLTFLVPAVLIIIFGNIFGGNGGSRGKANVIFVNKSNTEAAKIIEEKLDSSKSIRLIKKYRIDETDSVTDFTEEKAIEYVKAGKYAAAVVLPNDFLSDTSVTMSIKYYYDPRNEIESSIIQGSIQRTVFTQLPQIFPSLLTRQANKFLGTEEGEGFRSDMAEIVSDYFDVPKDSILSFTSKEITSSNFLNESTDTSSESFIDNLIKFDSVQLVGADLKNPQVTRIVGGWAIMFLLFSLTSIATSLFEEKQEGTLKRLLCMPVTRTEILFSKYLFSMSLGIVQLMVLFLFSWVIFDVDIFTNFLNLVIVIIISASAAVSFGMIITAHAKSLSQANGIATLLILVMSAVGGSWFPTFLFPDWLQVVAKFTLTYWSVEAFQQVMWRQAELSAITLHLLILIVISIVFNVYAIIRFNKGRIF
ncbi:MAG: ABC transporter permease [Bacteroidota bacterium]